MQADPEAVAAALFDLDEPWRSRFLAYVAMRTGRDGRRPPAQEELARWLEDRQVCALTARMLARWTGTEWRKFAGR